MYSPFYSYNSKTFKGLNSKAKNLTQDILGLPEKY